MQVGGQGGRESHHRGVALPTLAAAGAHLSEQVSGRGQASDAASYDNDVPFLLCNGTCDNALRAGSSGTCSAVGVRRRCRRSAVTACKGRLGCN